MIALPKPSQTIRKLIDDLTPHASSGQVFDVEIEGKEFIRIVAIMETVERQCAAMEQEVEIFRLGEPAMQALSILDEEAASAAEPAHQSGNVIAPRFGGAR